MDCFLETESKEQKSTKNKTKQRENLSHFPTDSVLLLPYKHLVHMKIFWPNTITNDRLLKVMITKQEPLENFIKRRRRRWLGHTPRMYPAAVARVTLTWTQEGRREWRRPRITWRRTRLSELKEHDTGWEKMVKSVQNREDWRNFVRHTRLGEKEELHEGGKE